MRAALQPAPRLPCQVAPRVWLANDPASRRLAQAGCGTCPLTQQQQCVDDALRAPKQVGVVGGLTANQRIGMRRNNQRWRAGTQ